MNTLTMLGVLLASVAGIALVRLSAPGGRDWLGELGAMLLMVTAFSVVAAVATSL